MSDHQLLTRPEAARRARISAATLKNLIRANRGPVVTRIGRKVFVRDEHLSAWIDRCAEASSLDSPIPFSATKPSPRAGGDHA